MLLYAICWAVQKQTHIIYTPLNISFMKHFMKKSLQARCYEDISHTLHLFAIFNCLRPPNKEMKDQKEPPQLWPPKTNYRLKHPVNFWASRKHKKLIYNLWSFRHKLQSEAGHLHLNILRPSLKRIRQNSAFLSGFCRSICWSH